VLLGDVVEGDSGLDEKFASSMSGLSAPLGVWGVLGNHESHGPVEENVGHLAEAGVRVLRNTRTEIRPGLFLAGVNDLSSGDRKRMIDELTQMRPSEPNLPRRTECR
jgi:predicted MPP superfamily phosphohydrolase